MKHGSTHSSARRRWIKNGLLSAGTAAVVTPFMPTRWQKPIVNTVLLPAHAQTSSEAGGAGFGTPVLSDPCMVALVSGDVLSATVDIVVSGSVVPSTGGETILINAVATPSGAAVGPVTAVTAADGTYTSTVISVPGPGVTLIDATATLGSSSTTCQLDVIAASGGGGGGGVLP